MTDKYQISKVYVAKYVESCVKAFKIHRHHSHAFGRHQFSGEH